MVEDSWGNGIGAQEWLQSSDTKPRYPLKVEGDDPLEERWFPRRVWRKQGMENQEPKLNDYT